MNTFKSVCNKTLPVIDEIYELFGENMFSVIDLETTGLEKATNEIIEIAIIKYDNNLNEVERYETFIKPTIRTTGAVEVHGITYDMLLAAPRIISVIEDVRTFLKETKIVAHNGLWFDIPFINYITALNGNSLSINDNNVIDTYILAKKFFTFPSNSLANIANSMGYTPKGSHRAMVDVETTSFIFMEMMKHDTVRATVDSIKAF